MITLITDLFPCVHYLLLDSAFFRSRKKNGKSYKCAAGSVPSAAWRGANQLAPGPRQRCNGPRYSSTDALPSKQGSLYHLWVGMSVLITAVFLYPLPKLMEIKYV